MAPERGPPGIIQLIDGLVFLLQPLPKTGCAQRTITGAAILIGYMPQDQSRMRAIALGQPRIHLFYLLTVYGRGGTVIVTHAVMISLSIGVHAHGFGIFPVEPCRTRAAGRGQNGINTVFIQSIDALIQPVKLLLAFFRLQHGPGEDTHGDAVDMRLLHELHIFL